MIRTVEGTIDEAGIIAMAESVSVGLPRRVLVTIMDEAPTEMHLREDSLLSESALVEDWNREEENRAWAHLQ